MIKKIENSNFNQRIFLFIVNTENLSNSITALCRIRLDNLSDALRNNVFRLLNDISTYTEENTRKYDNMSFRNSIK